MLLSFSAETKIFFTTPSSTYSFKYLYLRLMCLVHDVVVILLAINMAPTLSALTMTGSVQKSSCFPVVESQILTPLQPQVRLPTQPLRKVSCSFGFLIAKTGTPSTYRMKPTTLLLLTGSPA